MVLFSERNGLWSVSDVLQIEEINRVTRDDLYNILYLYLELDDYRGWDEDLCSDIWIHCWHAPIDAFPNNTYDFAAKLKHHIKQGVWMHVYDLIEYVVSHSRQKYFSEGMHSSFCATYNPEWTTAQTMLTVVLNRKFQDDNVGYRIINNCVTPIANEYEIQTIEQALHSPEKYSGVRTHISKAVELISKKEAHDYANVITQSIASVESAVAVYTGKKRGRVKDALKLLEDRGLLHPALSEGWNSIYGFTSDAEGLRHSTISGEVKADIALAKYMLVSCSSFANYLIELDSQSGEDR